MKFFDAEDNTECFSGSSFSLHLIEFWKHMQWVFHSHHVLVVDHSFDPALHARPSGTSELKWASTSVDVRVSLIFRKLS